jgi:hypothetical protein
VTDTYVPIPNPYASNEAETRSLNQDVMALFRMGSLLLPSERIQVASIDTALRLLARESREGVRALTWELCNVIAEHFANDVVFPPLETSDCKCPADHGPAVENYNQFLMDAQTGDYTRTIEYVDNLVGENVFDVLLSWAGVPIDHVGNMRYKD